MIEATQYNDMQNKTSLNSNELVSENYIFLDAKTYIERENKLNMVRQFIAEHCNLAPQGSDEWFKTRQTIIGGSELSILLGKNPFSSIADLVAMKCNLSKYEGNIATKWGNIFEDMTRILIHMIYMPDISLDEECIYETGSLEGIIPHHRFSPDGIAVVIQVDKNGEKRPLIVLLEFKSPLSSIPSSSIPAYYLPQVKAGLCDIDISELGLFVNNMYRKCSLDQFGNNSLYNMDFHLSDIKKRVKVREPLAIGIIGIYATVDQIKNIYRHSSDSDNDSDNTEYDDSPNESNTTYTAVYSKNKYLLLNIFNKSIKVDKYGLVDVGKLNTTDTSLIFNYIMNKYISIKYFAPNIYMEQMKKSLPDDLLHYPYNIISHKKYESSPIKFIKVFADKCIHKDCVPIGYIPWKLFMTDMIPVDKDPLYIYQFVPKINEVMTIITDICKDDNIEQRNLLYNQYFPNNKYNR